MLYVQINYDDDDDYYKSKGGTANKTDRQLQPGQWFGSQPSMVITLVNNVFIRAF